MTLGSWVTCAELLAGAPGPGPADGPPPGAFPEPAARQAAQRLQWPAGREDRDSALSRRVSQTSRLPERACPQVLKELAWRPEGLARPEKQLVRAGMEGDQGKTCGFRAREQNTVARSLYLWLIQE